jgi:hypothetical protein
MALMETGYQGIELNASLGYINDKFLDIFLIALYGLDLKFCLLFLYIFTDFWNSVAT